MSAPESPESGDTARTFQNLGDAVKVPTVYATPSSAVGRLRIPLNREINPDGQSLNVGTEYVEVPVAIEPALAVLGEYGYQYDYSRVIRLREWNEQVLLHEILHVVLDPILGLGSADDPHGHNVISRVEVALWETGWRMRVPPASVQP